MITSDLLTLFLLPSDTTAMRSQAGPCCSTRDSTCPPTPDSWGPVVVPTVDLSGESQG